MAGEIRILCDLTEKQYRDYMSFHVLGKKKELFLHALGALMIFLFALANFHTGSPILGWIFVTLAVYLFASRYIRFFMSLNRIVGEYGLSAQPKHFYTITCRENDFEVKNNKQKASYPWDQVYHIYFLSEKQMIYLYMTKEQAFLLPYSGIEGCQVQELYTNLKEKIGEEVTLK